MKIPFSGEREFPPGGAIQELLDALRAIYHIAVKNVVGRMIMVNHGNVFALDDLIKIASGVDSESHR